MRFDAPIYTTEQVLNEAGILLEIENNDSNSSKTEETDEHEEDTDLTKLHIDELNALLEDVVKSEDYDTAMIIQNEINRRNKKID